MLFLGCIEGETFILKLRNAPMRFLSMPLRGGISEIEVPLYRFGNQALRGSECCLGSLFSSDGNQALLDLILAKWEDLAWKNMLQYDVTACPTKVVSGGKQFFVQLNDNVKMKNSRNVSNKSLNPFELNIMNICSEAILFCVERGDKNIPVFVPSSRVPRDAILVIVNENPIEYGHVFLVPHHLHNPALYMDSLEAMVQVAVEMNSSSFRIFYDHHTTSNTGYVHFQACYFASQLPVEHMPVASLFDAREEDITILEIIGYPVKALKFSSKKNIKLLSAVISEACSFLDNQNILFSLLICDCGRNTYMFLQTNSVGSRLSAWECGGHFVYNTQQEYDQANQDDILQRMATVSIDDDTFQLVKRFCFGIPSKHSISCECK